MNNNNVRISIGGGGVPVVHNQVKNRPILVQSLLKLHLCTHIICIFVVLSKIKAGVPQIVTN